MENYDEHNSLSIKYSSLNNSYRVQITNII